MYTGWDQRLQAITRLRWYSLDDLIDFCHQVRMMLLSPEFDSHYQHHQHHAPPLQQAQSTGQSAATATPQIAEARQMQQQHLFHRLVGHSECPAAPLQRFPADALYVCEGIGDWGLRIDRLLMTLHLVLYPEKLPRMYPNIQTQGEAELSVFDAMHDVVECVGSLSNVMSRQVFEHRYQLQWVTTAATASAAGGATTIPSAEGSGTAASSHHH